MTMPVAILAGGMAKRLGAVCESTPKCLLEVAGAPFAVHQIRQLAGQGVKDILFCVGHLGEQIEAVMGDGSRWGVNIAYQYDGEILLGTGGALINALPRLGTEFFVLYGDSYLECDYMAVAAAFRSSGRLGLMTVCENDNRWDRSNVEFRDGQIICYDKRQQTGGMRHIDYGLGALSATAFDRYPAGSFLDLEMLYRDLLAKDQLAAFEVKGRFYEIGSFQGLEETRAYLGRRSEA
jgi:NDP-sugar pyrophosphorylase family protein